MAAISVYLQSSNEAADHQLYGLATTGYVELSNLKNNLKNYYLHAWIELWLD